LGRDGGIRSRGENGAKGPFWVGRDGRAVGDWEGPPLMFPSVMVGLELRAVGRAERAARRHLAGGYKFFARTGLFGSTGRGYFLQVIEGT